MTGTTDRITEPFNIADRIAPAPSNPLADALDRLHTQVMARLHEARQRDAQPYWEGRVDALDWVLQRIDDLKATFPAEWKP